MMTERMFQEREMPWHMDKENNKEPITERQIEILLTLTEYSMIECPWDTTPEDFPYTKEEAESAQQVLYDLLDSYKEE